MQKINFSSRLRQCYLRIKKYYYDDKVINYYNIILTLAFLTGILCRIIGISTNPGGLNQDEASIGYEAYSILKTGIDRTGHFLPVHLVSWGSGQNALYAYLSLPFIWIFGLNVFSLRLLSAVFGIISLFVIYKLGKMLLDKKFALILLVLTTIAPWHIMSSRWALEANILPHLILFGIYFIVKGIHKQQYNFIIGFAILAISLYSYGTSYMFMPLFFLGLIPYLMVKSRIKFRYLLISGFAFTILALPIILFVYINYFGKETISTFFFTIPRLGVNRMTSVSFLFDSNPFKKMAENLPNINRLLILQDDGTLYNAIPTYGTVYLVSNLFIAIAIIKKFTYFILKIINKHKSVKSNLELPYEEKNSFIFNWFLFTALIFIFTTEININRGNLILYALTYFAALGIYYTISMPWLKKNIRFDTFIKTAVAMPYAYFFILFTHNYSTTFKANMQDRWFYGFGDAIQYAEEISDDRLIVVADYNYIHVLFYNKIDPDVFRDTVEYYTTDQMFNRVKQFEGYSFSEPRFLLSENVYVVSKWSIDQKIYNRDNFNTIQFDNYFVVHSK